MENPFKVPQMEKAELLGLLKRYHIPVETWGTGKAKTVEHLLNEINTGESRLIEERDRLVREFSFLALVVLYKDNLNTYKLVEEKQVFTDGRERSRDSDISIGEKVKHNETDPDFAISRALQEELGVENNFSIEKGECVQEEVDSGSYPGLVSRRNRLNATVELNSKAYNPIGYTEIQPDKTSYFVWRKI